MAISRMACSFFCWYTAAKGGFFSFSRRAGSSFSPNRIPMSGTGLAGGFSAKQPGQSAGYWGLRDSICFSRPLWARPSQHRFPSMPSDRLAMVMVSAVIRFPAKGAVYSSLEPLPATPSNSRCSLPSISASTHRRKSLGRLPKRMKVS